MPPINERITELLIRHLEGELNADDQSELQQWRKASPLHEQIAAEFLETAALQGNVSALLSKEQVWERINEGVEKDKVIRIHPVKRVMGWAVAAACIILLLGGGFYLVFQTNSTDVIAEEKNAIKQDIAPGREGAILTLADGTQITLDSMGNGVVALQNGSEAILQNGQLVYDVTGEAPAGVVYNTMSTPKGRQFNLQLPDGTLVWLNAASSIHYPTIFKGKERRVDIQGEVYFEVAKNTEMPFRVNVAGRAEVEVLGTNFNINAYENESGISATLLEGSIRLSQVEQKKGENLSTGRDVVLKPGNQAHLKQLEAGKSGFSIVHNADLEQVIAWKNGLFDFHNMEFGEVMRQLERWYDIDVVYESKVPDIKLVGKMTRDVTLSGLLRNFGKLGARYKLEGRKVIVLP